MATILSKEDIIVILEALSLAGSLEPTETKFDTVYDKLIRFFGGTNNE